MFDMIRDREAFQLFFQHHPNAMYVLDTHGTYLEVNPAGERLSGYSRAELLGMQNGEILQADVGTLWEEQLDTCQTFESSLWTKDGSERRVIVTRTPILQDGTLIGVLGVLQDITEQNRVFDQLIDTERLFQLISNNSTDIIATCLTDGTVEYISPSIKQLGYHPQDIIGQTARSFIDPNDSPPREVVRARLQNPMHSSYLHFDVVAKDGSRRAFEASLRPQRDDNGVVVRIVINARDISERLKYIRDLERAQSFAHVGNWERDLSGHVHIWSDETYRIYGLPIGSVVTTDVLLSCVHPEDRAMVQEGIRRYECGERFNMEYRIVRPNGGICAVYSIGEVQAQSGGYSVFGSIQDVTERKLAEQAIEDSEVLLRKSEKLSAVGQLAAGMAHEIRNPLTSIKGFMQLMRKRARGDNRRYLDVMQSELGRMEMVINELLMVAKPQATNYTLSNLGQIISEVVAFMDMHAVLNNVLIQAHVDGDVPDILCEPNQLKQVFINIVKNGIEAMSQGGRLTIRCKLLGHAVEVECTDEGEGIPADKIAKLGEPFFTTKEQGTGLGLMVSDQIVRHHGGVLKLDSTVGRGTTVRVRLPLPLSLKESAATLSS